MEGKEESVHDQNDKWSWGQDSKDRKLVTQERNRFRIKLDYNSSRQLPSKFLLIGGHHFSHSPVIGSLPPDSFQISLTQFERSKRIIKKRINLIFLSDKERGLMNFWW